MNAEELYAIWAPPDSPWSAWAKPIVFAQTSRMSMPNSLGELPNMETFARARETAAIIDVSGPHSVLIGLALAGVGYRPVPLYNSGVYSGEVVQMEPILKVLMAGAQHLSTSRIRPDASPAFLLNAERMAHGASANTPGRYDNRWCVVPQDMPSADFLKSAGIKQVVLLADQVRDDVTHILCRYQEAGLILRHAVGLGASPQLLTVTKPPFYRSIWYRLGVFAGLRRNAAGGFGALVPQPSTSGGYG